MPRSGDGVRGAMTVWRKRAPDLFPAATVFAALSLCVAAGGGPGWVAVFSWLVGAAWVARAGALARGNSGGYAREIAARILFFAAAAVGATRHSAGQLGWIWTGAFVVFATVLVEPFLARALPRYEVANLPGFRDAPNARFAPWLTPATIAVLALAGLLGVVDVPAPVRAVLPLAALLVLGGATVIGLGNARDRNARRVRLKDAIDAYAPRFALYTGRDDGGVYQVAMWLPYLELLGLPFIVLTRRPAAVRELTGVTAAPVIARGSLRDLDDAVGPSLGAVFYVNSVANNSNVVGYRQMTHVYLGHGDSDKALSFHPAHAMYDQVFVAGPAAIERYARNDVTTMRPDAFVIVGRPQLGALLPAGPRAPAPTVLYAPTWLGYNRATSHSSLNRGVAIVRALLAAGAVVIFRPHPFSRSRPGEREQTAAIEAVLRGDAVSTGRPHRWGPDVDRLSFLETANGSEAMVADLSSVVVDYLGADKPVAVVEFDDSPRERFVHRHPVARGAYVIAADLHDIAPVLEQMLASDPLRAERETTRDYYLGGLDGAGAVAAFLAAARAAIG